nr:hypothetical protein [Tanacetum cinerariifolium]
MEAAAASSIIYVRPPPLKPKSQPSSTTNRPNYVSSNHFLAAKNNNSVTLRCLYTHNRRTAVPTLRIFNNKIAGDRCASLLDKPLLQRPLLDQCTRFSCFHHGRRKRFLICKSTPGAFSDKSVFHPSKHGVDVFPFDIPKTTSPPPSKTSPYYSSSESPYVIPTTDHPSPSSPRSPISSPSPVSHLMIPTSQASPESSNGQPSRVSTTSIPTPPPITRQRPANLRQNPKQRVPYNPSANHATVLPTTITEPTSFTIANSSPEWRQAMKEELKRDKNGAITRYKARFVAKGFRQQLGIDVHETFSPVVKSTTIRAVLSLAVTNDSPLRQLDIQNAFLHGNLKEHVYMKQPLGFIDPQRLNHGTIDNIICQLGSAFALKDLGPLNYFLGIEIVPHVSGILLSQKKYILELLQSAGLSNCNPVSSPMVTSSSLSLDDSTAFSNHVKYRQVVGSLQHVTLSRPDIAFAVNKVCQYMHAPTENHWSAVKRILRYLHGTVKHGVLICRSSGSTFQAFTDVLWKGNPDTSLEAFLDAGMIDEVEYKALVELTWLQALLNELGIRSSSTPILWCDNLGATYLLANPIFHARTKHVEIDYHFVREKVATPRFLFLRSKLQVVARP